MKEHEKNLEEIYDHFGEDKQNLKLKEEVKELFHELNFMIDVESVIDEESDVLIVLYQKYLNNAKLRERVKFKIDRTLKRIKSGYYNEVKNEN